MLCFVVWPMESVLCCVVGSVLCCVVESVLCCGGVCLCFGMLGPVCALLCGD